VTTCDDVRPLLPDHALGSLAEPEDTTIRRHLRGCSGCRHELEALREGLGIFASTLERSPPAELGDRVLGELSEEWTESRGSAPPPPRGTATLWRVAVAASLAVAVFAGVVAFVQMGRARDAQEDADSFRSVLATLGGTGFRVGSLEPAGAVPVEGSVVAYESSHDQSFAVVFVRTPEMKGNGNLQVSRSDGTTWVPGPIEFDGDGDAAAWWVTDRSIGSMTGLTVRAPDGSALATARIVSA
jgi:putative zinc finger protein